jgi:hypothetical protein
MYIGEILKTVNMMGKSLGQQVGNDPEALKHAQDSIEAQLKVFGKDLWVYNDSTGVKKAIVETKTDKETKAKATDEKKRTNREVKPKTAKPKATKPQSDSGTRSVRRTR